MLYLCQPKYFFLNWPPCDLGGVQKFTIVPIWKKADAASVAALIPALEQVGSHVVYQQDICSKCGN